MPRTSNQHHSPRRLCSRCGYQLVSPLHEPGAVCPECGQIVTVHPPALMMRASVKAAAAILILLPAIAFMISLVAFAPEEFGFSMHPIAVQILYLAIVGPPVVGIIAEIVLRHYRGQFMRHFGWPRLSVCAAVIVANYVTSVVGFVFVRSVLFL